MSSRWRRVRLFVLISILVLLVARIGLGWWADRRVQTEFARLEQKYGNLDGRSILAPQVPASENRARFVKAALALLTPGTHESGISAVRKSFGEFQRGSDITRVPADLRKLVDDNHAALAMLAEGRDQPRSSWDIDYSSGYHGPSLLDVRTLSEVVYLAALADIEAKKGEDAAATVGSGLSLGASMRQEPVLIVQLIRIAVATQQCAAVEQLITRSEPSKATLEDLSRRLAENRELDPMSIGLLGELKYANHAFAGMERGRVSQIPEYAPSSFWLGPLGRLGRPLIAMARVRYLQEMDRILQVQAGPRPRPATPTSSPSRWNWPGRLITGFTAGIERAIETGDMFNSVLSATELGVALRRYRVDHQTYPDALSQLVPAYLPRLPLDPFTGQPPVYARTGTGFTLKAQGGDNYVPRHSALEWAVPH